MAILTSLFTGISGLNAFGTGLSVVSNNIANMNTVGFKNSDVVFADIITQSLTGAPGVSQIGRGVGVNDVRTQFGQGSFETTSSGLDLAIDGNGFFQVRDASGAVLYSRAGIFTIDENGAIVNPDGLLLQGFLADATGNLTGQIGDISLASTTFPPRASGQMDLVANLNSSASIPVLPFDMNNPSGTSNFSTSITVYDSLGNGHLVTTYFRKSIEAPTGNTWEWFSVVDANDTASGLTEIQANGTLTFTTDGALDTETTTSSSFNFSGGATLAQAIAFDFGTSITTDGGTGLDGVTQFGSASAVLNQVQDGHASGALLSVSINQDGTITGLFTNGKSRTLGQVALARFNSPQGLTLMGNNLYAASADSGQPIIGAADTAGMGEILSNSLEMSNVDLAEQFVKMIQYQRGFQANSRVITTTDEILQELVNLKR